MDRLLKGLVAITCVAVLAALIHYYWGDAIARQIDEFSTSRIARACEEVVVSRLRSPSAYQRISISENSDKVTAEEFHVARTAELRNIESRTQYIKARDEMLEEVAKIKGGKYSPVRYHVRIQYEAPNAYGTPLRNYSDCSYVSWDGPISDGSFINTLEIRIDGKTALERIGEELAKGAN